MQYLIYILDAKIGMLDDGTYISRGRLFFIMKCKLIFLC